MPGVSDETATAKRPVWTGEVQPGRRGPLPHETVEQGQRYQTEAGDWQSASIRCYLPHSSN